MRNVYDSILKGEKIAILLDPGKEIHADVDGIIRHSTNAGVAMFLVGGSLVSTSVSNFVEGVKAKTNLPVVLFPGNAMQFAPNADAILFLSLISGRNPDFLIGNHVAVAPMVKLSGIEVIPTGYILIDGGAPTSVQYMSQTMPIPASKPEIAVATAIAGELLGLKAIYLEAGSGAQNPVPAEVVERVCSAVSIPIMVGGGLSTPAQIEAVFAAGANMVVIGNAMESNPTLLSSW